MPNRRTFVKTVATGVGFAASSPAVFAQAPRREVPLPAEWPDGVGLPPGWRQMRKLDAHSHVDAGLQKPNADWQSTEDLVAAAEVLGIDKLYCSRPVTGGVMAEIDEVRAANDSVLAAMQKFPQRIAGYCFVQPGNGAAALDEIDRCLEAGMIGIKLYNQYKINTPAVDPVIQKCTELQIPILSHSAYLTDEKSIAAQPRTSHAGDFCEVSARYPEAILILGHINGGGDWEWAIRTLRDCPNVYLDTSGSVQESDTIGDCVRQLGHERLLFATDLTMEGGVGKILSAPLTREQREAIFWRNFQNLLDRRKT